MGIYNTVSTVILKVFSRKTFPITSNVLYLISHKIITFCIEFDFFLNVSFIIFFWIKRENFFILKIYIQLEGRNFLFLFVLQIERGNIFIFNIASELSGIKFCIFNIRFWMKWQGGRFLSIIFLWWFEFKLFNLYDFYVWNSVVSNS